MVAAQATTVVPETTRATLVAAVEMSGDLATWQTGSELCSGSPSCKRLIYLSYFFGVVVCFLMNFLLVVVWN